MSRRVAVVGAGLGGLSAAIRLASVGLDVTVFESSDTVGGKAGESFVESDSRRWRFDTGPSLLTMPAVLEDLFAAGGARLEDYLELLPLDPVTRYWFADGTHAVSSPNFDRFALSMEQAGAASRSELSQFFAYSRRIWDLTHSVFLERSLHELRDLVGNPELWKSLIRLGGIDPMRTLDESLRRFFVSDKARQFFGRYATYNGSDPYRVPATLNLIPHVEFGIGAYAVRGGISAVPRALKRLTQNLGVKFRFREPVERILTDRRPGRQGGRPASVRGVRTDAGEFETDIVICNADVTPAYRLLLDDPEAPPARRYGKLEPSSSAVVFFWAMGSDYPELGLHNIFFSPDYRREFCEIFEQKICPANPTVYINITSKVDSSDAPSPGENWFVLVNAPADTGQDWEDQRKSVRSAVLQVVERSLGRSVREDIVCEDYLDPPAIEKATSSHLGSLYGIASNSKKAAFLRHPNRSRRYRGLYFAGGSAHPGGGMPLSMLSGKIAADLALRYGGGR